MKAERSFWVEDGLMTKSSTPPVWKEFSIDEILLGLFVGYFRILQDISENLTGAITRYRRELDSSDVSFGDP